ncbi:killer cell lectin-like receptor subfamily B member 1B allele C isoform X2 [Trachemys scripta elegans]|uniref:killer cell lectin-like receptor subfamily B member 1B allele C isoform X2 n=1 Tax=Trachemys scripta elegans TaxID=31138 RepID=UPI001557CB50|nr:killer cell lectin-like receptor subfamily B member 1B allele C isoform X2 [Trachemys scripta elegans]
MAGDIVYADLNIAGASSRPPHPTQHLSLPQCPHWHRLALGVGWAGNVILAGAVIVLGVWVTKGSRLEDFRSQLKQTLCVSSLSNSTEGSECKLCPRDWLLHKGKCYWVSKEIKSWKKSFEDCTVKTSQMLVIQDQDEMDFIRNVTKGVNRVWIGLNVTSPERTWMWVDGSLVNQTLFPITSLAEPNSCGVTKGDQIRSDVCGAQFKWVCQKEALQI